MAYKATFAAKALLAYKPLLSVADRDLLTKFDIAVGTKRYDTVLAYVLPLVHVGIRVAGMRCEAEEGTGFRCVEPALFVALKLSIGTDVHQVLLLLV